MSFLTTQPEALSSAASTLEALGTSMAAQNAAAAAPTTGIAPAAADPVSALQAAQFDAYGQLYQSVSAQATAIHQLLVNTLGTSAGAYGATEAANQTATGSASLSGLLGSLGGGAGATSAAALPAAGSTAGTAGGAATFVINGVQNFTSAASDLISQATIATLPGFGLGAGGATAGATGLASTPTSVLAGAGGLGGGTPVAAGLGQASSVGELSVPANWAAGGGVAPNSSTPVTLAGGPGNAAPHTMPGATVPAGLPSVASTGRGARFGAPRYGVKPTVMPGPMAV